MSDDHLRTRLETAAAGLTFASESDRPFEFVRFANERRAVATLQPREVGLLIKQKGGASEADLDALMARHLSGVDPADTESRALVPRYDALVRALRESFPTLRVFRIGKVEVQILILGNDPTSGELAGLRTVAVET
jgi:hypothetical protein